MIALACGTAANERVRDLLPRPRARCVVSSTAMRGRRRQVSFRLGAPFASPRLVLAAEACAKAARADKIWAGERANTGPQDLMPGTPELPGRRLRLERYG